MCERSRSIVVLVGKAALDVGEVSHWVGECVWGGTEHGGGRSLMVTVCLFLPCDTA